LTLGGLDIHSTVGVYTELNGAVPGSGYDQLVVNGTVSIGGAVLVPTLEFEPAVGQSFVIIENDGTDAVVGTFALLPEGELLAIGSHDFQISYRGGDGNDVSLTRVISQVGEIDAEFGIGGYAVPDYDVRAITPLVGGKFLTMGSFDAVSGGVTRYNLDGRRDTTFGFAGTAFVGATPVAAVEQLGDASQFDPGRIAVAAVDQLGFRILKLWPDGQIDHSFGTSGWSEVAGFGETEAVPAAIAAHRRFGQTDAGWIVAGFSVDVNRANRYRLAMARFKSDGTLDPAFGGDGRVTADLDNQGGFESIAAIDVDVSARIVVLAKSQVDSLDSCQTNDCIVVLRYLDDGSLDATFGANGMVVLPAGSFSAAGSLRLEDGADDSDILLSYIDDFELKLVRLKADGSMDPTFGAGGTATVDLHATRAAKSLVLQPNGKIITGVLERFPLSDGQTSIAPHLDLRTDFGRNEYLVMRLNANGSLDSTFGDGGFAPALPRRTDNGQFIDVALVGDGDIVVAGPDLVEFHGQPQFSFEQAFTRVL
jgi:uncharacterized delta-60 repeat protein